MFLFISISGCIICNFIVRKNYFFFVVVKTKQVLCKLQNIETSAMKHWIFNTTLNKANKINKLPIRLSWTESQPIFVKPIRQVIIYQI